MDFHVVFPPKRLTKEYILQHTTQESLMTYYLGLPVRKGLYKNPLRADNHITASFFKGRSGDIMFQDFALGKSYSFIDVVKEKYQCNYYEALRIIAKDLGLIDGKINKKQLIIPMPTFEEDKHSEIQIEVKQFTKQELDWWNQFGIKEETLKKFNVFSANTVFLNGEVFSKSSSRNFQFGYYFGKKDGQEVWKIYYPLNKKGKLRFLTNCPKDIIQGVRQLPKEGDIVVITKSMKDVIVFHELGIAAIAPNSENLFISNSQYNRLKDMYHKIIAIYDNDLPGLRAMNRFRRDNPEMEITWLWIPRKYGAKDISDLVKIIGFEETKRLIEQTKQLLIQ